METVGFTRKTNLTDIVGRIDYISNPKRQENIVSFYDGFGKENVKKLAKFSQKEFEKSINFGKKNSHGKLTKCIEGREIIYHFSPDLEGVISAEMVSKSIEKELGIKGVITALHWNKNHTCFHGHSVIPDRDLLPNPEVIKAERNLFFDSNGKRVYKKALADPSKTIKKGEIIEERLFSAKREDMRSLEFSKKMQKWAINFNNQYSKTKQRLYNKEIDGPAHVHEGNKPQLAEKRRKRNQEINQERLARIKKKSEVVKKPIPTKIETIKPVQISVEPEDKFEALLNSRRQQNKAVDPKPTPTPTPKPTQTVIEKKIETSKQAEKPTVSVESAPVVVHKTEEKRQPEAPTALKKPTTKPILEVLPEIKPKPKVWKNEFYPPSEEELHAERIYQKYSKKADDFEVYKVEYREFKSIVENRSTTQKIGGGVKAFFGATDNDKANVEDYKSILQKLKSEIKKLYQRFCELIGMNYDPNLKVREMKNNGQAWHDGFVSEYKNYYEAEEKHNSGAIEPDFIKTKTTSTPEQVGLNRLKRLEEEKKTKH